MAKISCFPTLLVGKKKKSKDSAKAVDTKKSINGDLRVKPEEFIDSYVEKGLKERSIEDLVEYKKSPSSNTKTVGGENKDDYSVRPEIVVEAAYEGGDEHEDILSMARDYSSFDLQALVTEKGDANSHDFNAGLNSGSLNDKSGKVEQVTSPEIVVQSGHVSDPGMQRTTEFWVSPMLKRSCSNIETKRGNKLLNSPNKFRFFDDPQNTSGNYGEVADDILGSPLSVMTSCSADKVMLKKRSSSQVLPSRSRKLWWKLFLWSHRNLHKTWSSKLQRIVAIDESSNQKGGYCSDTLETSNVVDMKNKRVVEEPEISKAGEWPEYQWVAFSAGSSSLDRVNAWVHSLDDCPLCPIDGSENDDGEEIVTPFTCVTSMEVGECSGKNHTNRRTVEEVVQANNIIQSLNTFSSVAHIASMGLKTIPAIAAFTSLRVVNLSGNFIVHISPGSLPKSLHTLDLSRNKISTIEGLRDLTRLRILNLSYNRISRIGHGLANCTLIKELYLAGNKISDVEGLHRLLKLTVVDLSFNKITTSKALGQLVANYNSLLALNLLGNPIQTNIGDDQLRKAVSGLLPQLAYLNKQPIKPQRAREVATDSVAKAALGNSGWNSRRRSTRRIGQSSSASIKGRIGEGSSRRGASSSDGQKNRQRSKSRHSARK